MLTVALELELEVCQLLSLLRNELRQVALEARFGRSCLLTHVLPLCLERRIALCCSSRRRLVALVLHEKARDDTECSIRALPHALDGSALPRNLPPRSVCLVSLLHVPIFLVSVAHVCTTDRIMT